MKEKVPFEADSKDELMCCHFPFPVSQFNTAEYPNSPELIEGLFLISPCCTACGDRLLIKNCEQLCISPLGQSDCDAGLSLWLKRGRELYTQDIMVHLWN